MNPDDPKPHPDQSAIEAWLLYGPINQEIEILVRKLTIDHGLRLDEVENLLVETLKQKLQSL